MGGLSASAWFSFIIAFGISFGGAIYCMLLAWGKNPGIIFEKLGITKLLSDISEKADDSGIYYPFEYMERGPKEKALGGFIVLVVLIIGYSAGVFDVKESEGVYNEGKLNFQVVNESWAADGNTQEGQSTSVEHQYQGRVNMTTFLLTWTDDDTSEASVNGIGVRNQPDTFRLTITAPNGTEYTREEENDIDTADGAIEISVKPGLTHKENKTGKIENFETGAWDITVECVEAGDAESTTGQTIQEDDGNDWSLNVDYQYFKKKSTGPILD